MLIQSRRHGGLWVCAGGLDTKKLTKTQLIYSVSCFNLGGLGALFGGISSQKPPVATGLYQHPVPFQILQQFWQN